MHNTSQKAILRWTYWTKTTTSRAHFNIGNDCCASRSFADIKKPPKQWCRDDAAALWHSSRAEPVPRVCMYGAAYTRDMCGRYMYTHVCVCVCA